MSMENAILEHANALLKLAEAIGHAYGGNVALDVTQAGTDLIDAKAAELATAAASRVVAAREAKAKDAQQNAAGVKPDADLEKAVGKVEDDAKSPGRKAIDEALAAAKAGAKGAGTGDDGLDTPLDYAKDVRPVLLAAIKKAGKDKVQALIGTFGVDKGDKVGPANLSKLLAGAQLLAA